MMVLFVSEPLYPEDRQFAFYNTVSEQFLKIGEEQVWFTYQELLSTWTEYEYEGAPDRLKHLLPDWAFEKELEKEE